MVEKRNSERIKDEDVVSALSSESPEISDNDLESKPIPTIIDDLDIQDIPGIGPTTAKKLRDAGVLTVMDLAVTSSEELSVDRPGLVHRIDKNTSGILIAAKTEMAMIKLSKDFFDAVEHSDHRRSYLGP